MIDKYATNPRSLRISLVLTDHVKYKSLLSFPPAPIWTSSLGFKIVCLS